MKALIVKICAFLFGIFAVFKWGQTSSKLKQAEKKADDAIKTSQNYEDINASPYVDNPADFLCYDDSEYPDVPEDAEKTRNKT